MKAQASLELIIILSLMLGILLIVLFSNNEVSSTVSSSFAAQRTAAALDDVAHAATAVYQQGEGAKRRVLVSFPRSINNASVANDTLQVNLYVRGGNVQTVFRSLNFTINGSLPGDSGDYWIYVESRDTYVEVTW